MIIKLIVLRGATGTGKSTMAEQWKQHGYTHVELDKLHDDLNPKTQEEIGLARVKKLLEGGKRVVVDGQFIQAEEVQPFVELAEAQRAAYQVLTCDRVIEDLDSQAAKTQPDCSQWAQFVA